jgi:probable F420-dependent oxidoreductase
VTRPFRFAVQVFRGAKSGSDWRSLVRRVEDRGYSTLFLADHYLGKGPATQAARQVPQYLAPLTAMASAAAMTDTLRVGSRVFCVDYHVPAALVKEAATLDVLSNGRLEFGIGAGWSAHEYEAMGLPFASPGERISKLKEVVALFKAQCAGDLIDIDGRQVKVAGYTGLPESVQRPHPPIMIGGSKPRVLSYAAREADIVSINNVEYRLNSDGLTPDEEARRRIEWVRSAAGERFPDLDIEASPFFTRVTDDVAGAARDITSTIGLPEEGFAEHPNVLLGSVAQMVDRLQARREIYGVNYVTVQQGEIDNFAPIVERLAGR